MSRRKTDNFDVNSPDVASENADISTLAVISRSDGLWLSSAKRLMQNRFAMLGLFIIIAAIFIAVFAGPLSPESKCRNIPVWSCQTLVAKNSAPQWVIDFFPTMIAKGQPNGFIAVSEDYPLGTDGLGRDLLSRIMYGSRISLLIAFVGPVVALLVGVTLGLVAGYLGGWVDNLIMRFTDVMYGFPTLLFIILLMAFFRPPTGQLDAGSFAGRNAAAGLRPLVVCCSSSSASV